MKKELLIGIDLGGTKIKAVLTNATGEILHEKSTPTHDIPNKDNSKVWKESVKKLIHQLRLISPENVKHIGISSPGTVNNTHTSVLSNGNKLLGIEGLIWEEFLGEKVYVLNDANAALFAESRLGVGKGVDNILMVTLGTGVGGGIMIDGKILQGEAGRAGHIGHVSVNRDIVQGIVSTPGSLENAVAEGTIKTRTYNLYDSTKDLVEAYMSGDTFATWTWLNSVQTLARALVSFMNILSPQIIILGGGIAKAGDALMDPLKGFLDVYEWRPKGFETPIVFANLGNHAGAIGAALFALEKKKDQ